ncbi:MAG: flagellar hook-associated protein FlgK [Nitrospirae bacterium]|nr:flagellar hook-associated protein FlgK [Nitrospirota bacterium]
MNISNIFNIGKSGLLISQYALSVTAHNVANADTAGYNRQDVTIDTSAPHFIGGEWIGSGVQIGDISRSYDSFLQLQAHNETARRGTYDAMSSSMKRVEDVFNENVSGVSTAMQDFFNAWDEVASGPEGRPQRISLIETANMLSARVNDMSTRLTDYRQSVNNELSNSVAEVNDLVAGIYRSNRLIAENGASPDLLDERERTINKLSEYMQLNRFEDEDGLVTVVVSGQSLVMPQAYSSLEVTPDSEGMYDIKVANTGDMLNFDNITGGKLKGQIAVRDTSIPDYLDQLDTMAYSLMTEVNALHSTGYGLDGKTGRSFFIQPAAVADSAANMRVFISGANEVAAASTSGGLPGNSAMAKSISDLQSQTLVSGSTYTDYYRTLVSQVGMDAAAANRDLEATDIVMFQLNSRMQEKSGVSLDEEASNIIRFQRSYEAAAKIIQTADQLFETILNLR